MHLVNTGRKEAQDLRLGDWILHFGTWYPIRVIRPLPGVAAKHALDVAVYEIVFGDGATRALAATAQVDVCEELTT